VTPPLKRVIDYNNCGNNRAAIFFRARDYLMSTAQASVVIGVIAAAVGALPLLAKEERSGPDSAFVEVDYSKIERRLLKEPRYIGKPLYALFILDPQAKFRVWAVLDKSKADLPYYDVLYFDRNGNGDLTDLGERFVGEVENAADDRNRNVTIAVGDVTIPGIRFVHKGMLFSPFMTHHGKRDKGVWFATAWGTGDPKNTIYGGFGAGAVNCTVYADSPERAPILRPTLAGPLTFEFYGWGAPKCVLSVGVEESIHLMLGSRGSGPDTFCAVSEDFLDLEKDVITATLVAKDKDGKELRRRFPIDKHC
jgi:hypothetical protein